MICREHLLMREQILLTGATGALGPALAAELVNAGAARRIAVLFRGDPQTLPRRFAAWRQEVQTHIEADLAGRTELLSVSGDICQEGLGISDERLERETDTIIHAAADTNFSAPQDQQWDVNVEGTRRMLEWAQRCRNLKRFLQVSSVFVSGSRTGWIDETLLDDMPEFVTFYQRTKWESEHVALKSGLPVGVARVSLVLGSHATGAVHSLIKWFSRGLVPLIPGLPEATGDVIATETAAKALAQAAVAEWKSPICQIAAGEHAPRMMEMVDFVYDEFAKRPAWKRRGIPRPKMVERAEYDHMIQTVEAAGRLTIAQAMRSINRFLPDLLFPKTYATVQAQALLGGSLPRYDWKQTMARVIHFCFPPEK
jgi:nucleoside-diphosphate-sugar epimerase